MSKKALIVWGGWLGHQPEEVAGLYKGILEKEGFSVEVSDTQDAFADAEKLLGLDLIAPNWTMGQIEGELVKNVMAAVQAGVGIAGTHGGMCDAFRTNVDWQFMTGGQWVAHPGNDGIDYMVNVKHSSSPLLEGIDDFAVKSEQYYMHVDPAVEVLATTRFPNPAAPGPHTTNKSVDMPVVWTKRWGAGRVFYCTLGHQADIIAMPQVTEIMRRGFLWAAEGKTRALAAGGNTAAGAYTSMQDNIL